MTGARGLVKARRIVFLFFFFLSQSLFVSLHVRRMEGEEKVQNVTWFVKDGDVGPKTDERRPRYPHGLSPSKRFASVYSLSMALYLHLFRTFLSKKNRHSRLPSSNYIRYGKQKNNCLLKELDFSLCVLSIRAAEEKAADTIAIAK